MLEVEDDLNFEDLSKSLTLKKDHIRRPIWVTSTNIIILEAFSPFYSQAYDFLIDIAEPIARPPLFQTYRLTEDSLYAAVAVSRDTESIIKGLKLLCKTELPIQVEEYIRKSTYTFGKAKLVLKDNVFFIESKYPDVLRELLRNETIKNARISASSEIINDNNNSNSNVATLQQTSTNNKNHDFLEHVAPLEDKRNQEFIRLDEEEQEVEDDEDLSNENSTKGIQSVSFMVSQNLVQVIQIPIS
jgi:DNA excision repair protein ERCC-3